MMDDTERELEELFASYADRLSAGEELDLEKILAENPIFGAEIVDYLQDFIAAGSTPRAASQPLGTLGDYTLRRQVGRGGMGVVYEAWENSMDRRVALKVLPAGVAADNRTFLRFMREAKTAGQLSHPNVVPVFAMGVKDQTPYYAMEFVEGETLAQVITWLKVTPAEVKTPFGFPRDDVAYYSALARAIADVADGLQHAHAKGVTHRDVKPSNLILDREGRLRILDFGLARLEGQEGLTLTGDFLGTPLYMSPEQARRKKIPVDHRTDVYSLGATLYEMLALRPPFEGKDHQDTLSQIIELDPVEPRSLNPRVPRDLETIVLKCLRKEPGERYGTAEALGQDLRRFARGDPIEARPLARWEKAWRNLWHFRIRVATALVAVVFLAGLGWQGILLRRDALTRRTHDYEEKVLSAALRLELASLSQKHEGGEEWFFNSVTGDRLKVPAGVDSVELALKDLDEAIRLIPGRPDAGYHRARALLMLQRTGEARESLEPLISRRHSFVPALTLLAGIQERRGEADLARRRVDAAEQAAKAPWEKAFIRAWRGWKEKKFEEIATAYSEILDACQAGGEPYVGCAIRTRMARGVASLEAKDYVAALRDFTAARLMVPRAVPPALLEGKVWYLLGRKDDAKRIFEETLAMSSRGDEIALAVHLIFFELGDDAEAGAWIDKIATPSVREQARCQQLFEVGRMEEAIAAGRKAVAADSKDAGAWDRLYFVLQQSGRIADAGEVLGAGLKECPDSYDLNWDQGHLNWRHGAYREAIPFYEKAIRSHPADLEAEIYYLAAVYLHAGEREKALATIQKAREVTPGDAEGENMFGIAYQGWGEQEEAIATFDIGIAGDPSFSYCYANKGIALYALGREEEALACWRKAQPLYPFAPQGFILPATVLERRGELRESILELLKALERAPDHGEVHAYLGRLLRSARGRLDLEAAASIASAVEKALERVPSSRRCKNSLAGALMLRVPPERRDLERAASLLLEALDEGGIPLPERTALSRSLTEVSGALASWSPLDEGRPDWMKAPPAYAATDAILAGDGADRFSELGLEALRPETNDAKGTSRLRYLEARLAEKVGDLSAAASGLAEVMEADPASVEPRLRLAEVLRATGEPSQAEEILRAGLGASAERALWDRWLQVCFVDSRRTAAEVQAAMPEGIPDDLRWLLGTLATSGAVRINCGAEEEFIDKAGKTWGKDRFFLGGWALWPASLDIADTEDDYLYKTVRRFGPWIELSSYVLPLPPGRYRVRLHFAEIQMRMAGLRRFDVFLQGERILGDLDDVKEAGFGHATVKEFETEVTDGSLEIRFERPRDKPVWLPEISAIEIEREG
jgi:tetratricopeptide (TPR) repeat protein